jgi:polysaccharide deacetylase 2 family uncharacterized protein YibQ
MSTPRALQIIAVAILSIALPASSDQPTPRIAIIIDDLGYQFEAGLRALNLPGPVSYAVLPKTPNGTSLALTAHAKGKEVLLHLPLESVDRENLEEPGAITLDMSRDAFHEAFGVALASVPYAIGVSNHRGSLLTRHPGHMAWLMEEIAAHDGMFFVDSFTTHESVALQIASESGVAATRRHIFLDNDRSPAALRKAFDRLTELARQKGVAVAIGHPYPETLEFLERELLELDSGTIMLIPVSQALNFVEPDAVNKL